MCPRKSPRIDVRDVCGNTTKETQDILECMVNADTPLLIPSNTHVQVVDKELPTDLISTFTSQENADFPNSAQYVQVDNLSVDSNGKTQTTPWTPEFLELGKGAQDALIVVQPHIVYTHS